MSDDQFWRIALGGLAMGLIVAIKPYFGRIVHRLGYEAGRLVGVLLRAGHLPRQ